MKKKELKNMMKWLILWSIIATNSVAMDANLVSDENKEVCCMYCLADFVRRETISLPCHKNHTVCKPCFFRLVTPHAESGELNLNPPFCGHCRMTLAPTWLRDQAPKLNLSIQDREFYLNCVDEIDDETHQSFLSRCYERALDVLDPYKYPILMLNEDMPYAGPACLIFTPIASAFGCLSGSLCGANAASTAFACGTTACLCTAGIAIAGLHPHESNVRGHVER